MWNLYKKVEWVIRGDENDGSETTTRKNDYYLVHAKENDEFQEYIASEYGSQDYNYQVSFKEILSVNDEDELLRLIRTLRKYLDEKQRFIEYLEEQQGEDYVEEQGYKDMTYNNVMFYEREHYADFKKKT